MKRQNCPNFTGQFGGLFCCSWQHNQGRRNAPDTFGAHILRSRTAENATAHNSNLSAPKYDQTTSKPFIWYIVGKVWKSTFYSNLWNDILMSVEKVMVNWVTNGQIRITAEMPCFSGHFGDFKTNPNGHEILRIIYRWKGMGV